MGCCNKKCGTFSLLGVGSGLFILGLILALIWNLTYSKLLHKELVLSNDSQSYELWKETPIPMYLSVYLFNWTNAEQVINSKWKVKPELEECGPYVFNEHHVRVNLSWNPNGTVTYQQVRYWHFLPKLSNGTLNDKITNLNPIVATIGVKVRDLHFVLKKLVNLALKGFEKNLVVTKAVDELLFVGFEDPILSILAKLHNVTSIKIPFNKFGWFYGRNGSATADGTYTMFTGETSLNSLGILQLWNGRNKTFCYEGNCDIVNGTSGELWPPVTDVNRVGIFSSDICSILSLDYEVDNLTVNGVSGKKFLVTDYNFDNGTKYPERACFKGNKVIPSGVRDVSKCRLGAPAFVSYPHFYLADPIYRRPINGLHPNKSHATYVLLEPHTGIPLDVKAQLQLNFYIEPITDISLFDNIKPMYMPMIWFRQSATLTEKYTSLAEVLLSLEDFGTCVGWPLAAIGAILTSVGIYFLFVMRKKEEDVECLLDQN